MRLPQCLQALQNRLGKPLFDLFVVATVCLCLYSSGLNGPFLHDDIKAVLENPDVQGTNPLAQLWSNDFWGREITSKLSHKSYRPLTILSFRLSRTLWGNSSFAFRLENLLLHTVVTCLFVVTCRRTLMFQSRDDHSGGGGGDEHANAAIVVGLLFACHPVHTEAVVGVVGRAELLSAIFVLLSLISYQKLLSRVDQDTEELRNERKPSSKDEDDENSAPNTPRPSCKDATEVACRRRKTDLKDLVLKGKVPTKGGNNSSEELNDVTTATTATTAAVSGNPLKYKSIISRTTSNQFTNMYTYLSLLILPSCALLCKETGESRN